ncbi:MAG: phosphoenolpyruvate--protein phosphotransferase [Ignavibacteriales bacterium]|nr:phosphoenolpyruvate--protein phosphotransferase [Ignavibacteriales bacterium]
MERSDNIIKGIAAAPGITIANAYLFFKDEEIIYDTCVTDIEEAKKALDEALNKSKRELRKVLALAIDKMGKSRAAIFEAQIMVLDDPILLNTLYKRIEDEKKIPEYIVNTEFSKYLKLMNESKEIYMLERANDIEDIKNRIIRNIKKKKWLSKISEDVIVVSKNLTPADTVLFSRADVKGYVTEFGGLTSHAAIVARSLHIPAVVGLHEATKKIHDGDQIIVDGFKGIIIINPDPEQIRVYTNKIKKLYEIDSELLKLRSEPAITKDGKKIQILGNLDLNEELEIIIQNGAEGLGLIRTEQMFTNVEDFPNEEEQCILYSDLAERVYPNQIIIRTFDIGGDKVLPTDVKENNPFLGWRGIRIMLDNVEIFKTQLRAILRASVHKNIKIMIPMITSLIEVKKSRTVIDECKIELQNKNLPFDNNIQIGVMIEVPSAAVIMKDICNEVDFVSIGTNDLIQYLLAVDRGNDIISDLYQEFHPAVIRTLKQIISEGKKNKIPVGLCGEMAADTLAIPLLIGLGLEQLSVSGVVIPNVKSIIRNLNYKQAKKLAEQCIELKTENEIKNKVKEFYHKNIIDDYENFTQ